ncbi:MAG: hypothetical protein IPO94_18895 [Saprospiraceae bacterium]|nr:hypothetical protein [Saprospiraceae bacterium]
MVSDSVPKDNLVILPKSDISNSNKIDCKWWGQRTSWTLKQYSHHCPVHHKSAKLAAGWSVRNSICDGIVSTNDELKVNR